MPSDFTDGKTFPRRGRQQLGRFLWLARVIDKARATAAGTEYDYVYPCPMDRGVFERWGITAQQFDDLVRKFPDDDRILAWLEERVPQEGSDAANAWLVEEKTANLDRQDSEEGAAAA